MSNKDVVSNRPFRHERRLVWRDDVWQKRLKTLRHYLSNDLVVGGAKRNRAVVSHLPRAGDSRDKPNMGFVLPMVEVPCLKKFPDVPVNILANDIPIGVVEAAENPSGPRALSA